MFRILAITAVVASLSAQPSPPQSRPGAQVPPRQPPIAYDVDVTLVEIDAVVTDATGRSIRDLRPEEFQVLEDGSAQKIDRVSFVDIPIERNAARPQTGARPATDVRSNRQNFDGRLYVLLLDDLHTAPVRSERVKSAARRFVEQNLQPGDVAAVVHVGRPGAESQDFTTDSSRLLRSITRFAGRKLRSETLDRLDEYNRQLLFSGRVPENVGDPQEAARALDARTVFDSIALIAERVAPIKGRRKALLWFGEGVSYDMFAAAGRAEASMVRGSSRAAVAAATRASLAIYGVDVRGLAGLGDEAVQVTSPARDPTTGLGATGLTQELSRSQENLRGVSNDTGGFAVVNSDEFTRAFERVVEETSAYYMLGYYPANAERDGRFRRIEVRVSRPGASVRARKGYIAGGGTRATPAKERESAAAAALREALVAPVPRPALPMAVHVAPFRGSGDKASVLVTVEYAAAAFRTVAGLNPEQYRLDASTVAVSVSGAVSDRDDSTILLNVKPETRKAMEALGFRTHTRLDLAPGRYQVRVAAGITGANLVGSVYQDVDVPDFSTPTPSMSGIVLTSVQAGHIPTAQFDERMRDMLPAPPTTTREFTNDGAMALFAEIYEAGDVTMRTRIRNGAGEVVFERDTTRTAAEMKRWKNGYSLQVSLRKFAPGDYVVRLEAVPVANGMTPVAREVPLSIR